MRGLILVVIVLAALYALDHVLFGGLYSAAAIRIGSEFFRRVL
jgi:hypothetical protein